MKPNFPFGWFDHVIIPAHDAVRQQGNVILSQGALNPIVNENRHQKNRILIALEGHPAPPMEWSKSVASYSADY